MARKGIGSITISDISDGATITSVTKVGTTTTVTFSDDQTFIIEDGADATPNGVTAIYADNAEGEGASLTDDSKPYINFYEWSGSAPTEAPSGLTYYKIQGDEGGSNGVVAIYADDAAGTNATFTYSNQEYVNFYEWSDSAPTAVPSGLTYVKFVGDKGDNATGLSLSSTSYVAAFDTNNAYLTGVITVSAKLQNISGDVTWKVNGVTNAGVTGTSLNVSDQDISNGSIAVQASVTYNSTLYTDTLEIVQLNAPKENLVVSVTNSSHSVPADYDGKNSVPGGSSTQIFVYKGINLQNFVEKATYDQLTEEGKKATWTISSISASTGITLDTLADQLSVGTNAQAISKDITTISDAFRSGTISFNIQGVTLGGEAYTLVATQSITKVLQGTPGNDSTVPGYRTATGYIYYQSAASTAPADPTITNVTYSWSTGKFSGGVIGTEGTDWNQSAPTFNAGNANKYWYAYYTVVEGASGNTITFGESLQGIGFSGLVTFTSDGYNISNGSTTYDPIHAIEGSATATTINGGKLTTGSISANKLKLSSGARALNFDPNFEDPTVWSKSSGLTYGTSSSVLIKPGATGTTYLDGDTSALNSMITSARRYSIDPTKVYTLTAKLLAETGSYRNMYIFVQFYDESGNYVDSTTTGWGGSKSGYTFGGIPSPLNTFVLCGGQFGVGTGREIPSSVRSCEIGIWFQYSGNSGSGTYAQYAQELRLEETVPASLIVDGSIDAKQLAISNDPSNATSQGIYFDADNNRITIRDATGIRVVLGNLVGI